MNSKSRPANAQHALRTQFPSIIRTRSQQQHPLSSVDMYASPLKEAIRNHTHTTQAIQQSTRESQTENQAPRNAEPPSDEPILSPPHNKRTSSPSFVRTDHAGKRTRVLGESCKVNSIPRRHSEESLGSPDKGVANITLVKPPSVPQRALSYGSPSKGITHMDLTKVSFSPVKPLQSPNKTFKITTNDGCTIQVPVTPAKRTVAPEDGMRTPAPFTDAPLAEDNRLPSRPPSPPVLFIQPSTLVPNPSTLTRHTPSPISTLPDNAEPQHTHTEALVPATNLQPPFTPIRSQLLGENALFSGSPLTPLPATPHPASLALPRNSSASSSLSNQGASTAPTKQPIRTSSSLSSLASASPIKSRIPLPSSSSFSRLPRPSSSLSISTLPPAGSSSPDKVLPRRSPIKPKPRVRGKVRSGIRSKAPVTRLAAKRGLRRTSLTGQSSIATTSNAVTANRTPAEKEKKLSVGSSRLFPEASIPTGPSVVRKGGIFGNLEGNSNSPKKPTPLTALSSALQRLQTAPPAAPAPRPRPNTSLGFAGPSLPSVQTPKKQPLSKSQDDTNVGLKTPGGEQPSPSGLQRSKTQLGLSHRDRTSHGFGKMGLPLRRPTAADHNGRTVPGTGVAFASKQPTLSTVPASPSKSMVPTEADTKSAAPPAETVDVDTWVKTGSRDNDQEKSKNTFVFDYLVPLVDEPRVTEPTPSELVSPSRRASQASLSLTHSLSLPRAPAPHPPARSVSTSSATHANLRTPIKTRGRTKPPPPASQPTAENSTAAHPGDPMGGKRSNARMPGSLDVLKDCVIFVDVRTEDGEDAAALFVDMLRGLGARILAKPGKSCTHLVYKAGLPSTITKYKLLPEPRPLPVSIGWVVECVEKRAHVEETRFLVNLDEIGIAGGAQLRRSMQPKQMRSLTLGQLDSGEPADISVRADSSFTSEDPSTSGMNHILANLSPPARNADNNLPPLERARQRSLRLSRE